MGTAAVPAAAPDNPPAGRAFISLAATSETMPGQQTRQSLVPLPLPEMLRSPATSLEASVPDGSPEAWQLLFTPTTEVSPAEPQFHWTATTAATARSTAAAINRVRRCQQQLHHHCADNPAAIPAEAATAAAAAAAVPQATRIANNTGWP